MTGQQQGTQVTHHDPEQETNTQGAYEKSISDICTGSYQLQYQFVGPIQKNQIG